MARRGSSTRGQRDDTSPSLEDLLAPLPELARPLVSVLPSDFVTLTDIQDNRLFDPEQVFRPALNVGGNVAPARRIPASDKRWHSIGFDQPDQALVCVRRKQRREVLFATRRRRRGGGGARRRTHWSNVRC